MRSPISGIFNYESILIIYKYLCLLYLNQFKDISNIAKVVKKLVQKMY